MHGQKADRERKVPVLRIEKHKKEKKNKNKSQREESNEDCKIRKK